MPSDVEERSRAFATGVESRRELLATVWAPEVLDEQVRVTEEGWEFVLREPGYRAYADNRFVVTDWRETEKTLRGVLVVVRGHMEYKDSASGRWGGSADGTEYLTLIRVDGEWRLLKQRVEDYDPS